MLGILGWIVFGLVVGAVLGGFLGRALGFYGPNDTAGIFMSILGAVAVLWIYRMMTRARS